MKKKKIVMILMAMAMLLSLAACADGNNTTAENNSNNVSSQNTADKSTVPDTESPSEVPDAESSEALGSEPSETSEQEPEGSKILVAYFSATNNTEGVAQKLADGLGADIYEIVPETPYTSDDLNYSDSGSRSSVEMDDSGARPAISGSVENMGQYDVVFIGYPIWWGEAPRIMSTFVESYDFSGKTLVAFCTSASSGFGRSDSALKEAAGSAAWLEGNRFSSDASSDEILEWANGLGIN